MPYSTEYYLKYIATLSSKAFKEGLEEMEGKTTSSTGKMEKGFGSVTSKVKSLISPTNLAAGAMAYLAYNTVQAVKDFAVFEKSMSKVNTMLKVSQKELKAYGNELLDISVKTGVARDQITEGAYQALSAGVSSKELTSFMETATKASVAGFATVETSVDAITTVLNAYNMEASEAESVTDKLLTIQANGKTTVAELGQYLSQVIPIAAAVGVSFDDVGGAISQLTASGTPTAQATTQIKSALAELSKEGTTANIIFTEMSGKSFQNFIAEGGSLSEALGVMETYSVKTGKSMLDLWSSVEAGQAALGLTGKNAEKFKENLDAMEKSAGELNTSYTLASDNVGTLWNELTEGIKSDWLEMTQANEGALKDSLKAMVKFAAETRKIMRNDPLSAENVEKTRLDGLGLTPTVLPSYAYSAMAEAQNMDGWAGAGINSDNPKSTNKKTQPTVPPTPPKPTVPTTDTSVSSKGTTVGPVDLGAEIASPNLIGGDGSTIEYREDTSFGAPGGFDDTKNFMGDEEFLDIMAGSSMDTSALTSRYDELTSIQKDALNKITEINEEWAAEETGFNQLLDNTKGAAVDIYKDAAKAIMEGRITSLDDAKNFLAQEIALIMMGEGEKAMVTGGAKVVEGIAYLSNPLTAKLAPKSFLAAAKNFAFAGLMGAGASALSSSSGSSSSEVSSDSDQDDYESSIEEAANAVIDDKKTTVYVDSEELWAAVMPSLSKYIKDDSTSEIILRRG